MLRTRLFGLSYPAYLSIITLCFMGLGLTSCGDDDQKPCSDHYPNGKLRYEVTCTETGDFNGEMKEYHEDGTLKAIRHFKDGLEQDTTFIYDEKGKLREVAPFRNNQLHGTASWYHPDGSLDKTVDYLDGEPHGLSQTFHKNSTQADETRIYQEGKLEGPYAKYAPDGTVLEKGHYEADKRHGRWIDFTRQGYKETALNYAEDRLDGPFAVYRPDGLPFLTGNFLDGKIDGKVTYYNKEGAIIRQEPYSKEDQSISEQKLFTFNAQDADIKISRDGLYTIRLK